MNSFPFHSEGSAPGIRLLQPMSDYMWSVQAALFIKTSFKQHVRLIFSSFPLQAASSVCCVSVCLCVCGWVWVNEQGWNTYSGIKCTTKPCHIHVYIYIYTHMWSHACLGANKHRFIHLLSHAHTSNTYVHTPAGAQICTNSFPSRLSDISIPLNNKWYSVHTCRKKGIDASSSHLLALVISDTDKNSIPVPVLQHE